MSFCISGKTIIVQFQVNCLKKCTLNPWGGGGDSLISTIHTCAAGQGIVVVLSVLTKVYNFVQVSPKQ